ncbi:MAG TPA: formimidoylglutamase [Pyrinomonadaceae bacterium]|jgi:formiminoglutamase|nr:formimidoylglutamase [Pyrinomonadaceae bacterium]
MSEIFELTARPNPELFFNRNDANDLRLGEAVSAKPDRYENAEVVIVGCPQDEGVKRNKGRVGAALAPDEIRRQFYKLTTFGVSAKILDLGNTIIKPTLEETHDAHCEVVTQLLKDGKTVISLGGGNDVSYPDGKAMAETFGAENWLGFNIDAHFDVRADQPRNSGTPYRQLLEEGLLKPENFAEMGYQPQAASPVYYDYLKQLGVMMKSIKEIQNAEFRIENWFEFFIESHRTAANIFWGFDVDAVRASDAPGVSAPSPTGMTAEEFVALAGYAGRRKETRLIEFTEVNPNFDIDNHTTKLAAIAMHGFCSSRF